MKVSAIVPTRNMAHFLDRAVGSLLAQTVPLHEIIIADDNSTDPTSLWIAKNVQPGGIIRVIKNGGAEPWGICGGRNAAFQMATGDAILPLDADDWIEPTHLEKTIPKLRECIGIVSTHMRYFGELEGTIIKTHRRGYASQLLANNITVCSLVNAQAIREAGPWDPNLKGWEDWDMWLRILKLGWGHDYVDEVLFHYRLHRGGMNQWANDNRETLKKYLTEKHPGFMGLRKAGKEWNGI